MTANNGTNNGTNLDNPRQVLAGWVDRRVKVEGYLEKLSPNINPSKPFLVGLVQDTEIELPTRARHHLGHIFVQHAETMKGCPIGSRVSCNCCVRAYTKSLRDGSGGRVTDYGLTYPRDVKVVSNPVFLETVTQEPVNGTPTTPTRPPPTPAPSKAKPQETPDPFAAVMRVRDAVQRLGGVAQVLALLDAVAAVGGWDQVGEVMDLAEGLGGADKLRQLIDLLRL
jgi:hypothetical protein